MDNKISLSLTVNGKAVSVSVDPLKTLSSILREDLKLTGTKVGCGEGECGACTVIVNGSAVYSCLIPAIQLEGAKVRTVEGLSADGKLHPLQQSFIDEGAVHCGFCTPGFLMAAEDMLTRKKNPSRDEIAEGLSGNLCRCTGYQKIITAVEKASALGKASAIQKASAIEKASAAGRAR